MTRQAFEVEWYGGSVERRFRQLRPAVTALPWDALDVTEYPPILVERARMFWTRSAFGEYRAAALFSQLVHTMLHAKVPVDLVAVVSNFVIDELSHVELASRLAMLLGGGAPHYPDFASLTSAVSPELSPLQNCSEQVLRLCCIESYNTPMLAGTLESCKQPLIAGVLQQILRDEAPHGKFGFDYLDWLDAEIDDAERQRLAGIAGAVISEALQTHDRFQSTVDNGVTTEGFLLRHINDLGWTEASVFRRRARRVMADKVVRPLREHGIPVSDATLPPGVVEILSEPVRA